MLWKRKSENGKQSKKDMAMEGLKISVIVCLIASICACSSICILTFVLGKAYGSLEGSTAADTADLASTIIGLIPAVGIPADIIGIVIDYLRGDLIGMLLSLGSVVPVAGTVPGVAEVVYDVGKWGKKAVGYASDAAAVSTSLKSIHSDWAGA